MVVFVVVVFCLFSLIGLVAVKAQTQRVIHGSRDMFYVQ